MAETLKKLHNDIFRLKRAIRLDNKKHAYELITSISEAIEEVRKIKEKETN